MQTRSGAPCGRSAGVASIAQQRGPPRSWDVADRLRCTPHRLRRRVAAGADEPRQRLQEVREKASETIRQQQERAGEGLESAKQNAEEAKENIEEVQESVEEAQEEARAAIASPVERIADSLDEHADEPQRGGGKLESAVKGEFGEYRFDKSQLQVFEKLISGIRGCAVASGAVAIIEILTTIGKAIYGGNAKDAVLIVGGVHVNNFSVVFDYGFTSILLFMAAKSFKRVLKDDDEQLQNIMQGLLQLAFVFMQASTITLSMGVIQLLQAARRWPPLVTWVTGLAAIAAVVRGIALTRILSRYTPGSGRALAVVLAMRGGRAEQIQRRMSWSDRLALSVVGGLVLPLTIAGEQQQFPGAKDEEEEVTEPQGERAEPEGVQEAKEEGRQPKVDQPDEAAAPSQEYEFKPQEEQLLELVMNGMRVAGIALSLQAFSTFTLAVSTLVHTKGWMELGWDAWNFGFHLTDQSLRAILLFTAAGFFCRAITTSGHDIENLVTALGDQGLSKLFSQTRNITKGVVSGLLIGWLMSGYKVAKSSGII